MKPTVLVLANAPTHRSEVFLAQLEKWMERELYIFFLPRYSPHLNKAETYWRKAKYEWLKPADYGRSTNSGRRYITSSIRLGWSTRLFSKSYILQLNFA
jgi:transposase